MYVRSRNWVLTINHQKKLRYDNDELLKIIQDIPSISFTAFQLEQGEQGTLHHQAYLHFKNAKTFDSIKKAFPLSHIEEMRGSSDQAITYCTKEETRVGESVMWGEVPEQGKRNDYIEINNMLVNGATNDDIRRRFPTQYFLNRNKIEAVRQDLLEERFGYEYRYLSVIYMHGSTGIGKSRYVVEKYGYQNCYRISNYKNPFDTYKGEDVIVFEEFRESLPIEQMLEYLDGYPSRLPARYNDKVACYTKVYVISNWDFNKQYSRTKRNDIETYNAFERRFNFVGTLEQVIKYEYKEPVLPVF
jgi:hypothetical protein